MLPGRPGRAWVRIGLLAATIGVFFLPWLEFAGQNYSGFRFLDFAAAVAERPGAARAAPITWNLVFPQPAIAAVAMFLSWLRSENRSTDFLAAAAMFIGPISLIMAILEVEGLRLLPAGYLVCALAAFSLVNDFRPRPGGIRH